MRGECGVKPRVLESSGLGNWRELESASFFWCLECWRGAGTGEGWVVLGSRPLKLGVSSVRSGDDQRVSIISLSVDSDRRK